MSKNNSILDRYFQYEASIGIEVHAQLITASKIFCSCENRISDTPNTTICPICAGYPGSLPVLNKKVVDYAILAGLATHCTINKQSSFDRKHYFYPDLPKNYQITQCFHPICTGGYVPILRADGHGKKIRLIRIHIEEDAGKNIHSEQSNESFIDLNRAGTPLLEIVSYPDIANAYEAKAYLKILRLILQYTQICTGNMEEGALRADINVSVRKKGATRMGTKCELKNINSFKFISDAIEYEIERQITTLEAGSRIAQETRLWDNKQRHSVVMRSKEGAEDYLYFQNPNLPFINISDEWVAKIKEQLPELPHQKIDRFCATKGLQLHEAEIIVEDRELADYFEEAAEQSTSKHIVNWILRDLIGYLKKKKIRIRNCKITPKKLVELVTMIDAGTINNHAAKEVFEEVARTGASPNEIVKDRGLEQIDTIAELEKSVKEVIAMNPKQVAQYQSGKTKLFGFFVGQMMKKNSRERQSAYHSNITKKTPW